MQNQDTPWHKRRDVIIPIVLGTIAGLLPVAVPLHWVWTLVCWLVWGSCILWVISIVFSSKALRTILLILMSVTLAVGGLHRVGEQWLKDHPVPRVVYRFPVNHLPEKPKEPADDETAAKPAAEPPRQDDVHQQKEELRPVVNVQAVLRSAPNNPASYSVTNEGPIDVLQLRAQLLSHKVHKNGEMGAGGYEIQYVEKLAPHTSVSYSFPEHSLDVPKMLKESAEVSALEIRVTYSYGPDSKKAVKSAFYFVNPKGSWVEASDRSLTPKIYDPVKKLLSEMLKRMDGP